MDKELLMKTLEIAWKGMLAIFIAMAIIFLGVTILNYISKKKIKKND